MGLHPHRGLKLGGFEGLGRSISRGARTVNLVFSSFSFPSPSQLTHHLCPVETRIGSTTCPLTEVSSTSCVERAAQPSEEARCAE